MSKIFPRILSLMIFAIIATYFSFSLAKADSMNKSLLINIQIDNTVLTARIDDTPIGRDFYQLLPLTITLEDYHRTEKVSDLPRRLTTKDAPEGTAAQAGDITYYAPWGNLAIFYKPFRYSPGLVRIGAIEGNLEALNKNNPFQVTITKHAM